MQINRFPCFANTLTLLALSTVSASAQAILPQTIPLQQGWNLIQLQVTPTNASPAAVFGGTNGNGFKAIWYYDALTALWQVYQKPQGTAAQLADQTLVNGLLPLGNLEPGKAYWVFQTAANASFSVSGAPPSGSNFPAQDLAPGWNMIGFPIGGTSIPNNEPISLLAVLTAAGFDYDAILTWEATGGGSYKKMFRPQGDTTTDPLAGLPADAPFPNYTNSDLGRGYWLRVTDPAVLKPRLVATVRPDIDVEPKNNFPAKEDVNVSKRAGRPSALRNVQVQDTIRFFPGEDVQTLSISNLSGADPNNPTRSIGGGIMIWEAIWTPITDTNTVNADSQPDPWIKLYNTPGEKFRAGLASLADYAKIKGVTTLENDIVYLRLDRKNLGRGEHRGTLLLKTSVGDKSYEVIAETGGLEGDWKGYATITTVNGKRNRIPDIDLFMSFFEDPKTDGLLRGLIDSSNALLWPVDVPLVGYRLSNTGNSFTLGGSFALSPGDQNSEPFDNFAETLAAGNDIDWNNNGFINSRNPYPFPIQRTVSFSGALITGNPSDGYNIEGDYSEIVHGMTKEPIKLLGRFSIQRQALTPLASRRSVALDTGVEPVISKTAAPSSAISIPANTTRPTVFITSSPGNAISIQTEMELHGLQVGVQFAALPHANFRIRLRSPDYLDSDGITVKTGKILVLYDGLTGAITPKSLEKITFPTDRPTKDDFNAFLIAVERTKSEPSLSNGNGNWRLDVTNFGPDALSLTSWSLRLDGQPVTNVSGVIKTPGGVPVSGATVTVNGLPFSAYGSGVTDANGVFTFLRLPIMPVNFTATHPAFLPANPSVPGLSTSSFLTPFSQAYLNTLAVGNPGKILSAAEIALRDRFNPLAGSPIALGGVDGFASGTFAAPFELNLVPATGGPVTILAGPLFGTAGNAGEGHRLDFYVINAAGSALWDFGDGATSNSLSGTHEFTNAGHYQVTLKSPSNSVSPQASVDVVVMPTVRKAPATPSVVSLPSGNQPPAPGNTTPYPAYLFQPFFGGGGSLPMTRQSGTVGVSPDVYALGFSDPPVIPVNGSPVKVGITTFQHMYCASMDIDLAPTPSKIFPAAPAKPYIPSHDFSSDGFDAAGGAFVSADFNNPTNVNAQGFKEEDFNYNLVPLFWQNTRLFDKLTPEFMGTGVEASGGIVWGNISTNPDFDYAILEQTSRDGHAFTPAVDDAEFNPHPGTSDHTEDLATHAIVTHYQMACFIGGTGAIITAPTPPASVKPAKDKHITPDNPLDPDLVTGAAPTAGNLYFVLHTGGLDSQPRPDGAVLP